MKQWVWQPWLIVSVVFSTGALVLAGITGISVDSTEPIMVGYWYTYSTDEDGNGWADSYDWDYKCLESESGLWTPDPPDWMPGGIMYLHDTVGTREIRARAYFHTSEDPPEGFDDEGSTWGGAVGPSYELILSGIGTDSSDFPIMELTVVFDPRDVKADYPYYVDLGPDAAVVRIQERIVRGSWDSGWVDAGPYFYLEDADIHDIKAANAEAISGWDTMPNGHVFDDFTQTNRIVIKDCDDQDITFTFSTHSFHRIKTSATTWKLSH